MTAVELYREGRLDEAIQALGDALRKEPADAQRRVFLFELLCFAGQLDRAEKQLDVLARNGSDSQLGALLYRAALHAERTRQEMFATGAFPESGLTPKPVSGKLNGQPFSSLTDADPRIGARLELFAAGEYMWIPLEHIESVRIEAPKRLRDLCWTPAVVVTGPSFEGREMGELLTPALAPLSHTHPDGEIRLGQATEWVRAADGTEVPLGQKLLLVDGEEFPLLELRELTIDPSREAAA